MPSKKSKLKNRVPAKLELSKPRYTAEEVEAAIIRNGGYLSHVAEDLKCPLHEVQKMIEDSKSLTATLFQVKETFLDQAESVLMEKISKDKNLLAIMFYLKCQGKERGWIDRPPVGKAGDSAQKPLYIKILPINGIDNSGEEKKKGGRPKKMYAEVAVLPAATDNEIIDV